MTKRGETRPRIEKGIPIPRVKPRGMNGTGRPLYRWDEMEIGDSFLFPQRVGRASYAAAIQASKGGKKFKVYSTPHGFRCWRTK